MVSVCRGRDRSAGKDIMAKYDVVVVGGGIAGSALGAALAPAGISVLVLERQIEYHDKVRGEYMQPWGVAELLRLGFEKTLLGAGGGYTPSMVSYDEDVDPAAAEAAAVPLSALVEGVRGGLAVGHPQASQALNSLARERGADVRRGVGDVEVVPGATPVVRYELDGALHEVTCRLVVGADGRQSTVRRSLGINLEQATSKVTLGGMLVKTDDWRADQSVIGTEGDRFYLASPRPDGYVRLYLTCEPGPLTSGADRGSRMLEAFRLSSMPDSDALADAEQAGPCAYYVGTDAWTDRPVIEGVVLIGDAAGWSDPIIGAGLSVAMRDARLISDVLLAGDDWSPDAFDSYVTERAERVDGAMHERRVDTRAMRAPSPHPTAGLAEVVGIADVLERQEPARFDLQDLRRTDHPTKSTHQPVRVVHHLTQRVHALHLGRQQMIARPTIDAGVPRDPQLGKQRQRHLANLWQQRHRRILSRDTKRIHRRGHRTALTHIRRRCSRLVWHRRR